MAGKIIIYRLGSIGDTVAALPCFHLIERAYPDSERILLTNFTVSQKAAPPETVLKDGGFIHGSIGYPIGLRNPVSLVRLASKLRAQQARTLIYLAASRGVAATRRDVRFFKLCGFSEIVGAPLTPDLHRNSVDSAGLLERESHRLARTLAPLGRIDLEDRASWDLRLTDTDHAVAERQLVTMEEREFVAVNTGGKAWQKDWGRANWWSLLERLGRMLEGWGLVFFGSGDDGRRAGELTGAWSGDVLDLCGSLTPRESAAALSHAALFIGHDSGPLHLADAVGTPSVGIFGDYNRPRKWHPSGPRTRVIHSVAGLASISPMDVVAEVSGLVQLDARS
jgi:heptosyltransferase-3